MRQEQRKSYPEMEFKISETPRIETESVSKPDWRFFLDQVVKEKLEKTDPSHDYLHILRVKTLAKKLADQIGMEPSEWSVTEAIVLAHDLQTYPKKDKRSLAETQESADLAEELLKQTDFPKNKISSVVAGVLSSSLKRGRAYDDLPGLIASLADKLDQTGAMFVMRYAASSGMHPMIRKAYSKQDPFGQQQRELKQFQFTLDAMLSRRPKVEQKLAESKLDFMMATAQKRNIFLDLFEQEFKEEIKEQKQYSDHPADWLRRTGAMGILTYFQRAGKLRKAFYNTDDPFGEKPGAILEPAKYPVHAIVSMHKRLGAGETFGAPTAVMDRRKRFTENFLDELRSELSGELVIPEPRYRKAADVELGQ